jgi:hypothetical protein
MLFFTFPPSKTFRQLGDVIQVCACDVIRLSEVWQMSLKTYPNLEKEGEMWPLAAGDIDDKFWILIFQIYSDMGCQSFSVAASDQHFRSTVYIL